MRTERNVIDLEKNYFEVFKVSLTDILFFDIETTGFLADVTALYMMGFLYFDGEHFILEENFADSRHSEKEILERTVQMFETKKILICYNGTSFDLPYLSKKFAKYNMPFNIENHRIIDYYREFTPFKTLFQLESLKQPCLEAFCGRKRKEDMSGKELIKLYPEYLKLKEKTDNLDEEYYSLFYRHNAYDLLGLAELTKLYHFLISITSLAKTPLSQIEFFQDEKNIRGSIKFLFAPDFTYKNEYFRIKGENLTKRIEVRLPIFKEEMKFFYEDYENYYYLPKEDRAIHKQIGKFVEKKHRERAKVCNCYTKLYGTFLYLPKSLEKEFKERFKREHSDSKTFIRMEDFLKYSNKLSYFEKIIEEAK